MFSDLRPAEKFHQGRTFLRPFFFLIVDSFCIPMDSIFGVRLASSSRPLGAGGLTRGGWRCHRSPAPYRRLPLLRRTTRGTRQPLARLDRLRAEDFRLAPVVGANFPRRQLLRRCLLRLRSRTIPCPRHRRFAGFPPPSKHLFPLRSRLRSHRRFPIVAAVRNSCPGPVRDQSQRFLMSISRGRGAFCPPPSTATAWGSGCGTGAPVSQPALRIGTKGDSG